MKYFITFCFTLIGLILSAQITEVAKLKASDAAREDQGGYAVGISGNFAITGAPFSDDPSKNSGRAYIFAKNEGGMGKWGQMKTLVSSTPDEEDQFGYAVSISGDYAIVGAPNDDDKGTNAGAVYIFKRNQGGTNNWGQLAKIFPSDIKAGDLFGQSLKLDGEYLIVGSPEHTVGLISNAGAAYIFARNAGGADMFGQIGYCTAADPEIDDRMGIAVDLVGNLAIAGAPQRDENGNSSGVAYVFVKDEGGVNNWGQMKKLKHPSATKDDFFGLSVALTGDQAFIGVPFDDSLAENSGSVVVFSQNKGGINNWGYMTTLVGRDGKASDFFGNALDAAPGMLIVGSPFADQKGSNSGAVSMHLVSSERVVINMVGTLEKGRSDDNFGFSVALGESGGIIAGIPFDSDKAYGSGAAVILDFIPESVENGLAVNLGYIYPNPVKDLLHVQLNNQESGSINLVDVQGRVLKEYEIQSEHVEIDLSSLAQGNYILEIQQASLVQRSRVIKN